MTLAPACEARSWVRGLLVRVRQGRSVLRGRGSTKRSRGVPVLKERAKRASREGRSACEGLQPEATNTRLSMTGHRQSARDGVPTRPRCVSRHGRVAVNRPRSRVRRSERDATRLSAPRCPPGIEWRTPTIKLPLASGPAPQTDSERVSPTRRTGVQAPPAASASARAGRGS